MELREKQAIKMEAVLTISELSIARLKMMGDGGEIFRLNNLQEKFGEIIIVYVSKS